MKRMILFSFFIFTTTIAMGQSMSYGKSLQEQINISDEQVKKVDSLMTVLMPEIMAAQMKDPENATEEVISKMMMERLATVLTNEQMKQFQEIVDEAKQQSNKLQEERKADKRRYYAYLNVTDQQIEQIEEIRYALRSEASKRFPYDPRSRENFIKQNRKERLTDVLSEVQIQRYLQKLEGNESVPNSLTLNWIKETFDFELTDVQAQAINEFEKYEKGFKVGVRRLSEVETLEQERVLMESILSEEQYKYFLDLHEDRVDMAREAEEKHRQQQKELKQSGDIEEVEYRLATSLFELQKDVVYPIIKDIKQQVFGKLSSEDLELIDTVKIAYKVYLNSYEEQLSKNLKRRFSGEAPRAKEKMKIELESKQLIPTWDDRESALNELGLRLILQTKEHFQAQNATVTQLAEDIIDGKVKIIADIMGQQIMNMVTNAVLIEKEKQQLFLSALLID